LIPLSEAAIVSTGMLPTGLGTDAVGTTEENPSAVRIR